MSGWVNPQRARPNAVVLMSVGSSQRDGRALMLNAGRLSLWAGGEELASGTVFPGETHFITMNYPTNLGGTAHVKVRGWNVKAATVKAVSIR
jgi:hypothetical protein